MSHNDFRTRICIIFTITTEAIMKKESTLLHMPEALSSPDSSIKIQNADSEVLQLYQMNASFQLTLEYCSGTGVEDYVNIVTMSPERSILYQETLPEKNRNRTKAIPHFHDYFEFAVVLEGSILQVIEGKEYLYTSGSCCLLNRSLCHLEHYHSRSKVLFIGMSPDFAMELFRSAQNSSFQCEKDFYNSDIYRFIASDLKIRGKRNTLTLSQPTRITGTPIICTPWRKPCFRPCSTLPLVQLIRYAACFAPFCPISPRRNIITAPT